MNEINRKVVFSVHAAKRMFERGILMDAILDVIKYGEIIEEYPDDWPYPSRLLLGWPSDQPVHVVVAENATENELIVVTLYHPDPDKWDFEFKRRLS